MFRIYFNAKTIVLSTLLYKTWMVLDQMGDLPTRNPDAYELTTGWEYTIYALSTILHNILRTYGS